MNTTLVTTGLVPLVIDSVETFQLKPFLNKVPWQIGGGSVTLYILDPNGMLTSFSATVAAFTALASYTVIGPAGTWSRAWKVTDSHGRVQKSRPIPFAVTQSP